MRRYFLAAVLSALLVGSGWSTYAENPLQRVQISSPSTALVGTWRSGSFAYTFNADGTYVYVGAMGGTAMRTQTSEEGTYAISGDKLIIRRQSGLLWTSQNYRQDLGPETRAFQWRLGNTQSGPGLQLIFPDGQAQVFNRQ